MGVLKKILIGLCGLFFMYCSSVMVLGQDGQALPHKQRKELIAKRSAYSKTFRNMDGTTTVQVSSVPVHYRTAGGAWEVIDTTLENAASEVDEDGEEYGFKVVKNAFQTYLPKRGRGWVTLKSGQSSIAFKLISNSNKTFRKQREGIIANEVLNNCDLSFTVKQGALKEDLILKNSSAPKSFEYLLKLRGLRLENKDGQLEFIDGQGKSILMMTQFFMYDAKGEVSKDIDVRYQQTGQVYRLTVTPSQAWLTDPARVYPVTVDPTIYDVTLNCGNSSGDDKTFYFYIPSNSPPDHTVEKSGGSDKYINKYYDIDEKRYKIKVDYTFYARRVGMSGTHIRRSPYIEVFQSSSSQDQYSNIVLCEKKYGVDEQTIPGSFEIPANYGAKIIMYTGLIEDLLWVHYGWFCQYEITYQDETMSPKEPTIKVLSPETYSNSVTLEWSASSDEKNYNADPDVNESGVKGYFVQRSSDPNFATDVQLYDAGNNLTHQITNLSYNTTQYFRVFAQDFDGNPNPSELTPWDPIGKPNGVRWSAIIKTKCVAAPENAPGATPTITDIIPSSQYPGDSYIYCSNPNPAVSWNLPSAPSPQPFIKVSGTSHSVFLNGAGTVWTSGDNTYGQLGDGTINNKLTPVQVKGGGGVGVLSNIISVSAGGGHSVALKSDGTVRTWGRNDYGQLGDDTLVNKSLPVKVKGPGGTDSLTDIIAISAAGARTFALKSDGTVWAWGNNSSGQLGDGTTTNRLTPVQVKGPGGVGYLSGIIAITGGGADGFALKSDGTVWAWGDNTNGLLGDGTQTTRYTPVQVKGPGGTGFLSGIVAISARNHAVALKNGGTVWTWGLNDCGQLGDGTTTDRWTPVQVKNAGGVGFLTDVTGIAAGSRHTVTLKSDGTLVSCGCNVEGELGDGTMVNKTTPVQVKGENGIGLLTGVTVVTGGNHDTIVLKNDGSVWGWGNNTYGRLGIGTTENKSLPVLITKQKQNQLRIVDLNSVTNQYPPVTVEQGATSAQTNWNLPDGNYSLFVGTPNTGGLVWSEGKLVTSDTTSPVIDVQRETIDGNTVKLHFSGSEPVKYDLYWGTTPDNLQWYTGRTDFVLYDGTQNINVYNVDLSPGKHYFYRFVCADKASHTTSTPICTIGGGTAGNNIIHTDSSFHGLASYFNYKTISLGRAGTAQVNLNNGNLIISATDFTLPGRGIPLTMSRYYNSLSDYEGILGKGWRSSFESFLKLDGQNVIISDPDGSSHYYVYVSDTDFTPPPGEYRKIVKTAGTYTVIEKNGTEYYYGAPVNGTARLMSISDRFDNVFNLTYDGDWLSSVREPSGRQANFTYTVINGNKYLESVTFTPLEGSNPSRYVSYVYQGKNLIDVRYPFNSYDEVNVKYQYDPYTGLLNLTASCLCDLYTKNEKSGSRKNETLFVYKTCSRSVGSVSTTFKSYNVNFTDYLYGPSLPVNALYCFDYDGSQTTLIDPIGNATNKYVYQHNEDGQCVSVMMPTCTYPLTYTYDTDYNLMTLTQKKLVYDPGTGNETLRDVVTEYNYSGNGNLLSVVADKNYRNLTTTLAYEPVSRHNVETDLTSITDLRGNSTNYINTYDGSGKLTGLTVNSPGDYIIVYGFDQYGGRTNKDVKRKDPSNPENLNLAIQKYHYGYEYESGLLKRVTNAYGTTTYDYTVYGERKSMIDANRVKTGYGIDPQTGFMTGVEPPVEVDDYGNPISGAGQFDPYNQLPGARYRYDYDLNGSKTYEYDAKNNNKKYFYDELNRLYRVEVGVVDRYNSYNRYDANGNLLQTRDLNQKDTTFEYDALNRKVKTKDGANLLQEELVYDEAGRVKIRYDGKLNKTEYFYDCVDNLLCVKVYEGLLLRHTLTYTYDNNGNLVSKTLPLSSQLETGTIVTGYQYDALNRPVTVGVTSTNNKYDQTVSYTYETGQMKTMAVSTAGATPYTYLYDNAQRLDTLTNPSGQKVKMEYLPGGQRKKKSVYKQGTDQDPFMTVDYKYDTAYRLKNLDYLWQTYYLKMAYQYNELDKIIQNPVQYNVFAPGVFNFLIGQVAPMMRPQPPNTPSPIFSGGHTSHYTYDDLGRLIYSKVYGINPVIDFGGANLRGREVEFNGLEPNGNPGQKVTRNYNGHDWSPNSVDSTIYDYLNRVYSTNSEEGYYTMTATYDANGNEIREHFNYDSGNRPDTIMDYGLDNQMLNYSSETKKDWHQYDDGSLIWCYNKTDKKYTYQLGEKLLRQKSDIHDSTNPYDVWNAHYDDYYYYSHDGVMAERHDDTGVLKNFTRFGRELICCQENSNEPYYYIQNIRGDVVMLVGSDGVVWSIRDYDASGQMLCQAPRDRDPFGFTGGLDAGNGLWKLGARFYDSGKNAFIQQDKYLGDPSDPLSLNRYVYCELDPVNYVDPTGFSSTATISATMWWLCAVDSPVLPFGDIAYGLLVLGSAVAEYGPQLMKLAEVGGDAVQKTGDETTKETKSRNSPGKDGAKSEHEVEKDANGDTISVTHKVTKNGEVIHQHQSHIGKHGTRTQFPNEWVENPEINN